MSDQDKAGGARMAPGTKDELGLRNAGEDLRSVAQGARDAASEVASTVGEEATAAAAALKKEGAAMLDAAKERAQGMAQEGVRAGADQASGVARAIHRAADDLQQDSPALASTIHDAAGAVDDMARALRDRSPGDMLRSIEDFARRQPLVFFGAAALAGFALARFARASAPGGQVARGASAYAPAQAMPRDAAGSGTAANAPGWSMDAASGKPRPATLAAASLGGSAAYGRPAASRH